MIRSNGFTLIIGLTPLVCSAEKAKRDYVVDRQGKRPAPVVAVDNVAAWPNLTVMRDGTIIATIHNQPSHFKVPGDVECWASTDHGVTWTKRGMCAPRDDEKSVRGMIAAGVANNGDLIVLTTGHNYAVLPDHGELVPTWVSRSKDGGRTWTIDKDRFPRDHLDRVLNPFGDVMPGADGHLRVPAYKSNVTFILTSRDDGLTWGSPVRLTEERASDEVALFHLGRGHWLAAARSTRLDLYASTDDAATWTHRMKLTNDGELPGHIMRLRKGLLLSYGNRNEPRGVDIRLGNDDGSTWSDPLRVLDCAGDIGYPSSVLLPDGQVLTAYYAQSIAGHDRYHMGVVVWDPVKTQAKFQ